MVVVALSLGAMREATSLLSAAGELRYGTESLFCFALKLGAAFSFLEGGIMARYYFKRIVYPIQSQLMRSWDDR